MTPDPAVVDHVEQHRFEQRLGDEIAFVTYRRDGNTLHLLHAEVPASLVGRGAGSALVRGVLELVALRGERVVPRCSFVARYIAAHPNCARLLAPT